MEWKCNFLRAIFCDWLVTLHESLVQALGLSHHLLLRSEILGVLLVTSSRY